MRCERLARVHECRSCALSECVCSVDGRPPSPPILCARLCPSAGVLFSARVFARAVIGKYAGSYAARTRLLPVRSLDPCVSLLPLRLCGELDKLVALCSPDGLGFRVLDSLPCLKERYQWHEGSRHAHAALSVSTATTSQPACENPVLMPPAPE